MPTSIQLKSFLTLWLLLFWSVTAIAAQVTFVGDMRDIPPAAVAISVLLSIIGGAAYTASKIAATDIVVKSVPLEVLKDVLTSVVVGFLIFCLGSYLEWPSVVQAGLITLGGYGGSRILEPALATFIKWISRLGGDGSGGPSAALPGPSVPPVPPTSPDTPK